MADLWVKVALAALAWRTIRLDTLAVGIDGQAKSEAVSNGARVADLLATVEVTDAGGTDETRLRELLE